MYFTIEPSFKPLKKIFGNCYPESFIVFKDNKVTWFLDEEEFGEASKRFTKKTIFNLAERRKYFQLWNEKTKELLRAFNWLEALDLTFLTDHELKSNFSNFSRIYFDWWLTISLELVTVSIEPMLGQKIKPYFPDEHPKEYNWAFATLSSPLDLTFYRREQQDLLRIYFMPKSKHQETLKKHQENFYWMYNSYFEGKVLGVDYFKKELEKFSPRDAKKLLSEIDNYPEVIQKQKKEIYRKIDPTKELLDLVSLVERFSSLQDKRKMNNFRAEHFLELFVQEFSRRTKVEALNLKLLLPEELVKVLESYNSEMIAKRKESFVFEVSEKSVASYCGHTALVLANEFLGSKDVEETMIHGILASAGENYYFRGTAKVVLSIDEIGKIEEGDILVTTMTSPDFVIGMRKAGAIITDTGGVLCHAAIVSREFKKPCIVGTGIATKVIHDGDVVELHCGRGTVKIIKSH